MPVNRGAQLDRAALDQAALLPPQSVERLLHVAGFVFSTYNNMKRTDKPFKNLQNATYELVYPEKGLRMITEKVCYSRVLWGHEHIVGLNPAGISWPGD